MKITIIPIDGAVYKDGFSFSGLDLSFMDASIHALQWFDTKGWIEFKVDEDFNKPVNQNITSLPEWVEQCLLKWEEANTALIAAQDAAALQAAEEASQQQTEGQA